MSNWYGKRKWRLCYISNGQQEIVGFKTLEALKRYMDVELPSDAVDVCIYSGNARIWI